jgi:hypothetical protein
MAKKKTAELKRELTHEQRRDFLKMSLAERRRQMAKQAARMVRHYESATEVGERERWQGGDIVELS